jgi:hypothetical protein
MDQATDLLAGAVQVGLTPAEASASAPCHRNHEASSCRDADKETIRWDSCVLCFTQLYVSVSALSGCARNSP